MATAAQIQAASQQARSDLGTQYRQLRLQLKGARGQVRSEIQREIGQVRSRIEAQEQEALTHVREAKAKAERKGELPGFETARPVVKRKARLALAEIKENRASVEAELTKARKKSLIEVNKWYSMQVGELEKEVSKAESSITEWEKTTLQEAQVIKLAQQAQQVQETGPSIYQEAIATLKPYKANGGYDIVKAMASKNSNVEWAVRELYGWDQLIKAQVIAADLKREPVYVDDLAKWILLSPEEQGGRRPVVGVTLHEYADIIRELDPQLAYNFYIKPIPVSAETYAGLSDKGREYVYPELTTYQAITPWREELGETPTKVAGLAVGFRFLGELLAPATRAFRPDVELSDLSKADWALTAINPALIATGLAPGALLGRTAVTGLATTGAGFIGYETAQHWDKLSPGMRTLGIAGTILFALPALSLASRNIKLTSVKVPTIGGEVTAWRGLGIAQHPVIGKSGGKWIVGARNLTLPEARLILDGYHPQMMLETKVFVNKPALLRAGLSSKQVDYLILSLKNRNLFAGKGSKFLSEAELLRPTERLDASDIQVIIQQISKYNKQVKQADLIYGSATIRAQLAPELRQWRGIHDWDIRTAMSQEKTVAFANDTLVQLRKLPGARHYKIDPKNPTHILKKVDGKWEGIADIHSREVLPTATDTPASKLDTTGDYSYGKLVTEKAITIDYPGVGKLDIMRLSESGIRKADTLLRVRRTDLGPAFRPPERGIASPGVPKDAADFYVILKSYELQGALKVGTAEEWARAWARAMGYSTDDLSSVLPKVIKAMEEVSATTPSNLIGYRFTPSMLKATTKTSPILTIHIPDALSPSISASMRRRISQPIYLYEVASKISPSMSILPVRTYPSAMSQSLSQWAKPSPALSKISPVPKYPSMVSVSSPSGYPSPGPSPIPSPTPSPSYTPTTKPTPVISTKRALILPSDDTSKAGRELPMGSFTWRQGFVWVTIIPPYRKKDVLYTREAPQGATKVEGPGSAYETITKLGVNVPKGVMFDMGIMDVQIKEHGKKIAFKRDIRQRTKLGYPVGVPAGMATVRAR